MHGSFILVCICEPHAWLVSQPSRRGHRDLLKNGAKESFEPQCESLEANLGALEEQVTNTLNLWVITPATSIVFLVVFWLEHFDDFLTSTKKEQTQLTVKILISDFLHVFFRHVKKLDCMLLHASLLHSRMLCAQNTLSSSNLFPSVYHNLCLLKTSYECL